MDLFYLDRLVFNFLINMKGYDMFIGSLFAWGIIQSLFPDKKVIKK